MTHGLNAPQRARYSDHSLAVYLAPLLEGRRVAVVGPTSGDVAKRVRALGAATVVAFGGAGEGVAVRALTPGAIAAFHGKLDCVIVPDAASVPLDAVLDEARRALGQDGIVAVASRPPGAPTPLEAGSGESPPGLGYYELYDALAARFATVQMAGRGPIVGYAVAALGDTGEGVSLDTRLMVDEPASAEAFIAVASDHDVVLEGMAIVQVPAGEVLAPPPPQVDPAAVARAAALEAELGKRDIKLKEFESSAAERWVKIQRLEHDLKGQEEEGRKARDRAVKLAKDLDDERKLRQRIELDAQMSRRAPELPRGIDPEELQKAQDRAAAAERELASLRAASEAARGKVHELERELDETHETESALRSALDAAEADVERLRKRAPTPPPAAPQPPPPAQPDPAARAALEKANNARAALEHTVEYTRAELATARAQVTALTSALAAARRDADDPEFARLERELRARADEARALRDQVAARDAAVRELAYALQAAEQTDAAMAAQEARERLAELASLNGALAAEAAKIVEQNELLRDRVTQLEAEVVARAAPSPQDDALAAARRDVAVLTERLEAVEREAEPLAEQARAAHLENAALVERLTASQRESEREVRALREQLEAAQQARGDVAVVPAGGEGADAEADAALRARVAEARSQAVQRALDDERVRTAELSAALADARNSLSRQYALTASIEDRGEQTTQELEGARAGYQRRVRELEREVEHLLQALEVVGAHTADENESVDTLLGELDVARAERVGLRMRLNDAEASLAARTAADPSVEREHMTTTAERPAATESARAAMAGRASPSDLPDAGYRNDQLLADLAATAERLAATEESLLRTREAAGEAERRAATLHSELHALRTEMNGSQSHANAHAASGATESLEATRREAAERELLVRSLVAQLEDRDLRLRALERRLIEEVERARRTESEIWEVELRARDQRLAMLSHEVERLRSLGDEPHVAPGSGAGTNGDVGALREAIEGQQHEIRTLRASLDHVKAGLSSILVDGRGAVVAHDLVTILREIEEPARG